MTTLSIEYYAAVTPRCAKTGIRRADIYATRPSGVADDRTLWIVSVCMKTLDDLPKPGPDGFVCGAEIWPDYTLVPYPTNTPAKFCIIAVFPAETPADYIVLFTGSGRVRSFCEDDEKAGYAMYAAMADPDGAVLLDVRTGKTFRIGSRRRGNLREPRWHEPDIRLSNAIVSRLCKKVHDCEYLGSEWLLSRFGNIVICGGAA